MHATGQPAEHRQACQAGDEGSGEQPLQVVNATGNAHGFAHRAQHEVTGKQAIEQQQAGDNRRAFAGLYVQPLIQAPPPGSHTLR